MDAETLDLITTLLDRVEMLEARVAEQDDVLERIRRRFDPIPVEVDQDGQEHRKLGLPNPEEAYVPIWGPEKFERQFNKPAQPIIDKMRRDGRIV
jgi:hypothetical protein